MSVASIASITLGDNGVAIPVPPNGITVIVGPNNSGKSVLLRNIHAFCYSGSGDPAFPTWPSSLTLTKESNPAAVVGFLDPWIVTAPVGTPHAGQRIIGRHPSQADDVTVNQLLGRWNYDPGLSDIHPWLVALLDATSRLTNQHLQSNGARDPMAPAHTPMDRLWDSTELEQKISALFKRAFGFEVCINRYSPRVDGPLIGTPNRAKEPLPPRKEFLEELASLPSVLSQGDGVRSFASILMSTIVAAPPIVLIDEPEAFLHPPQAKLLGRFLAQETSDETQVILATHSTDVIHGILGTASDREVKIIRLDSSRNVSVLPNAEIAGLWKDGLLRYSRMLDGLVHQGVVICEADADCRFYAAVMDARASSDHDVHFTHVGGKSRLAEAAGKLHRLSLRPAVIADIDLLNDKTLVKRLVEAVEGDFSAISADLDVVAKEVGRKANYPTAGALKDAAQSLMGRADGARISDAEADQIQAALKRDSGWKAVKQAGYRAFSGEPLAALERVLARLQEVGIFVVPVGELERWEPAASGHGPEFVAKVLEADLHRHPSRLAPTSELKDFITALTAYMGLGPGDDVPAVPVSQPPL